MAKTGRPYILDLRTNGPQTSLLAVALVVVLSLALVGVLLFENQAAKSRVVEEARRDAYHEAMVLSGVGVHAIEHSDRSLVHLASFLVHAVPGMVEDRDRLVDNLYSALPDFPPRSDLAVFDPEGNLAASTSAVVDIDEQAMRPILGQDKAGALDVTIAALSGARGERVLIGRRYHGADGQFAGVITATIDFSALDAAQDLNVTHQIDGALFVAQNGTVLASWPATSLSGVGNSGLSDLLGQRPNLFADATGIKVVDSDDWVHAISPLRNAPIFAVVAISKARVLHQWQATSWAILSWVFAIIAAVGALSAVMLLLQSRRNAATEKLFRTLSRAVEASPAMVFICDAAGVVEYVNLKFTEFSGLPFGEVVGIPPYFLDKAIISPQEVEAIKQGLSSGEERCGIIPIENGSGNLRSVSVMISPVRNSRGGIVNIVGSMEDVTDRVESERRLRKMQKTEALECLVGGISHEFNNMLMPVVGLSELALSTLSEANPARKYVEKIRGSGKRAAQMIDQVRAFSLPDVPSLEKYNIAVLIDALAEAIRPLIPEQVSLKAHATPGIGSVLVDRQQVEMVVGNLVRNGVQAISDGPGILAIEAHVPKPSDGEIPRVEISVSDTGCGMTADATNKVFDPFFTTREVGEGSGLGLSIAQGIINAHGGSISIESVVGHGTTVRIRLPLLIEETVWARESESESETAF